jgi:diacylglycerol kinase family enzyme
MQSRPRIEVRTRGVAHRLDSFGRPVGPALGPGATLYTGPALIAAVSTIPCYGYNFKLFPFAGSRRGMMQLRIGNVSVPAALARLPSLWQGTSFEGVFDFWVEDVEVRVDRKAPFQIGGDAEGYRDYARFTMWKDAVELMDFSSTQCV